MICKETVTKFCCEDLALIENYEQTISDNSQTWECHHRLEVQDNKIVSRQELINNNLYYNRPANELIFLTCSEHSRLHSSNRTEEVLKKVSESQKGRKFSQEHCEKLSKAHSGKHPWNYGKKVDSIHWHSYDEEDYESFDEYLSEFITEVAKEIDQYNKDIEPVMVHN